MRALALRDYLTEAEGYAGRNSKKQIWRSCCDLLCSLRVKTFALLHNSAVEIKMTSIVRSAVRPVCRFLDRRFFVPACCHVRWNSASSQVSQARLRIDTYHEIMFKSQY